MCKQNCKIEGNQNEVFLVKINNKFLYVKIVC